MKLGKSTSLSLGGDNNKEMTEKSNNAPGFKTEGISMAIKNISLQIVDINKRIDTELIENKGLDMLKLDEIAKRIESLDTHIKDSNKKFLEMKSQKSVVQQKTEKNYILIGKGGLIEYSPIIYSIIIAATLITSIFIYYSYNGEKERIRQEYESYELFYRYFLYKNYMEEDYPKFQFMISKLAQISDRDSSIINEYNLLKTHFEKSQEKILLEEELKQMKNSDH